MDSDISTSKNELYQLSLKMLDLRKQILDKIHNKSVGDLTVIEMEYKTLVQTKNDIISQLNKQKIVPRKSTRLSINFNKMLHSIK